MAGLLSRDAHRRRAGLQPLAGAARRTRHPPQHRAGLRLQRLQAAADQGPRHHRLGARRLEADRARPGSSPSPSSSSGCRPPCSAAGWSTPARGRAAWWPPAAGGWLLHLGPRRQDSTRSGCSISATACSAAAGSAWATSRPVSTLIKWFPDRRGMATGMAIMGFGGGAMIASPLSQHAAGPLPSPTSVGVAETFVDAGRDLLGGHAVGRLPLPGARRRDGSRPAGARRPRQPTA